MKKRGAGGDGGDEQVCVTGGGRCCCSSVVPIAPRGDFFGAIGSAREWMRENPSGRLCAYTAVNERASYICLVGAL